MPHRDTLPALLRLGSAVTAVLAQLSFTVLIFGGLASYWSGLFVPPPSLATVVFGLFAWLIGAGAGGIGGAVVGVVGAVLGVVGAISKEPATGVAGLVAALLGVFNVVFAFSALFIWLLGMSMAGAAWLAS